MHRFSASISSLRGGGNDSKKGATASPQLGSTSEFGSSGRNTGTGGLPPIPQDTRKQTQQQQHHQRRQSLQSGQPSSTTNSRRQSLAPSSSYEPTPSPRAGTAVTATMSDNPQQVRSPTAGLHSLPACAQLLNARKVYKAGYVWRLDGHPSSSSSHTTHTTSTSSSSTATATGNNATSPRISEQPHFTRYYMRLEDCILCLWPDEGLKQAQAQGNFIHPTSMNLQDGFVVLAETKREWQNRAAQFDASTPFMFVLNTAGNNSVTFTTDNKLELQRWINTIRLSIWERQRLENLYTAARLGIKEEQQLRPIRSAISFSNNGAKMGRAEGLLDVRLPGDTEWKRVYAVLTEPGNYRASLAESSNGGGSNGGSGSNGGLPTSASNTSLASTSAAANKKKEKRKSFMSSLFGITDSSSSSANTYSSSSSSPSEAHSSPVMASYNTQLEDPNVGPTLALFGILPSTSTTSLKSPNLRSSTDASSSNPLNSSTNAASNSSLPSNALKLTRRPLCVINQVWSAYAVWPENEALIPHARTFKLHGRMTWLEQEVLSYPQASSSSTPSSSTNNIPSTHTRTVSGSMNKDPMIGFEEAMKRENKDLGKADNQVQLLCMLVGSESDANLPGPSHAVALAYKGDTGSELLSWILGFYDAFRLHGRPDRMLYDPRNPLSPYFAQPAGPARGGLYFDPPLIEDLPQFQDNHPRAINDGFLRILVDRMMKALGGNVNGNATPPQQPVTARDVEAYRREGLKSSQKGNSAGSTPPVLPVIGESQNSFMGAGHDSNSGRSTPTNANRNMDKPVPPQPPTSTMGQDQSMCPPRAAGAGQPYVSEDRSSPQAIGGSTTTPTVTPPINQPATMAMFEGRRDNRSQSPYDSQRPFVQGSNPAGQSQSQGRSTGSPQSNYGTPSPARQGGAGGPSSVQSSPMLQAGMFRPGSANSRSSDGANRYAASGQRSPYLSDRGGGSSSRVDSSQGGISRGSHVDVNDQQQESLQGQDEGLSGGSTDLDYYNSRKVRSNSGGRGGALGSTSREATPAPSDRAPSALSSVGALPPMPGQYIPTPDLTSNRQLHQEVQPHSAFASASASNPPPPPNSRALTSSEASPHRHGQDASEQTLRQQDNYGNNSSIEGSSIEGTSTMAAMGSLESSRSSDRAEHGPIIGGGRGGDRHYTGQDTHQQHDAALFDEPAAMYALSLADNDNHHLYDSSNSQRMSRDPSSTASGHTQNSLSKLIMNRASVANGGMPSHQPPSASDRSDSLALSDGRTETMPSRQHTYASSGGPVSAAPTSASEYSQTGTMAELFAARSSGAPSRSASQHLQQSQPQPSNLSKQISNTSNSHSAGSNSGLPSSQARGEPPQNQRESKASTASTVPSEGQDDYLAALSYVALTEPQEEPPTPRMSYNGKPVISIQTSPQSRNNGSSNANTRQPYSSTDTEPSSTTSPTYDEPLSPDPYGTYAENPNAAKAAPKMRVTNASPEKKSTSMPRSASSDKSRQASMTSRPTSASRKPGRGVPRTQKSGKKLGTWSSDEDDDDDDDDKDSVDEEEEAERKKAEEDQRKAAELEAIAEAERYKIERQREERPNHLRESTTSSGAGSFRRSLPGLPGPSTDPYLNRTTSPPASGMYPGQEDRLSYAQDMQQQQYAQQYDPTRGSMYGWPNQMQMPMNGGPGSMMSPPWQAQQQQHRMSAGGSGSPYNPSPPYGNSPSSSAYNVNQTGMNNQNTMLAYMPDNSETAAADGKAMRNAAVAQHGLLQTGIEQKQNKSAAQQEALAKETGGPLLQLEHKAQMPQGGLVGAIASHERDRKRDGGLGATLTERDRERRMAEARQREMDQMGQRQPMFGGPGFGMPGFGGMMPGMMPGFGSPNSNDPVQMQQQIAMLAAQNAYLQAMAGFNQGGLMGNQGNYMSPPFSPPMGGYNAPGSQAPYAGSYMGMPPPSQSPHQFQGGQEGYPRGSPGASGDPRQHGRQGSRTQSDFFGARQ